MEDGVDKQAVIDAIEKAFAGVKLGNGLGLFEAQGHDDYASEEECAKLREKDEKDDWHALKRDDLEQNNPALSFFDAEGMRFHLPAYLMMNLEKISEYQDMSFSLSMCYDESFRSQYDMLNDEQKTAVAMFIKWAMGQSWYDYDVESFKLALKDYWQV